jgi:hypothetical protein
VEDLDPSAHRLEDPLGGGRGRLHGVALGSLPLGCVLEGLSQQRVRIQLERQDHQQLNLRAVAGQETGGHLSRPLSVLGAVHRHQHPGRPFLTHFALRSSGTAGR